MTQPQPHVWHKLQGLAVTCSQCAQATECVHYEFPEPMLPETEPQIIIIFYHLDSAGRRLGACVQYRYSRAISIQLPEPMGMLLIRAISIQTLDAFAQPHIQRHCLVIVAVSACHFDFLHWLRQKWK